MIGRAFDPWALLSGLDVEVRTSPLPLGWHGAYHHRQRVILLAPGLSIREERCALTHELFHAWAGDAPSPFGLITQRQERLARRRTAEALVEAGEFAAAEELRGAHVGAIAHELEVTSQVVRDWMALRGVLTSM
jgi:Zn-dependent peptidase ImmA (M78 family)